MKIWMLVGLLGVDSTSRSVSAQQPEAEACAPEGQEIYTIVEQMPRFPGGEAELFKYLGKNMSYLKCPGEEVPPSRVYLSFIVRNDGTVCGVEVTRGSGCEDHDEKLRSMVLNMPPWEPGIQRGKPVNVRYVLPIRVCWK